MNSSRDISPPVGLISELDHPESLAVWGAAASPGHRGATSRNVSRPRAGWLLRRPQGELLLAAALGGSLLAGAAAGYRPLLGVAVGLGVGLSLLVLARPAVGAYLLVALVPITSGMRPGLPIPRLRLSEALIGGVGALILISLDRHEKRPWRLFDWSLLGFAVAWLVLGLADAAQLHTPLNATTLDPLLGPLQFVLLFRAVAVGLQSTSERQRALSLLFLASIPVSILAVLQQLRLNSINHLIAYLTGGSIFQTAAYHVFRRATGPFDHWTPLAGYLTVILVIGVGCLVENVPLPISRRVLSAVLLLDGLALLFSAEISALGGVVLAMVLIGRWSAKRAHIGKLLGAGLVVVGLLGGAYFATRLQTEFATHAGGARPSFVPQTIAYRFEVWDHQYIPAIIERPLLGYGELLPVSITWPFPESQYIDDLIVGGVPVLLLFSGAMLALYFMGRDASRRAADDEASVLNALGLGIAALAVVLVAMDAVFPYLTSGGLPQPLFVVAGILASCRPASDMLPRKRQALQWNAPRLGRRGVPDPAPLRPATARAVGLPDSTVQRAGRRPI